MLGDKELIGRVRVKVFLEGSIFELEDELELVENGQVATVNIFKQYELGMQVKLLGMGADYGTNITNTGLKILPGLSATLETGFNYIGRK